MAQRMVVFQPKPGDLIEIVRGIYQHWAIYDGDGYVIHLTTPSEAGSNSTMSVLNEKGIVKKEKLSDVADGDKYYINNLLDKKYEPRSISRILSDARSWVGEEMPYSVILRNCEHFVTDLRYGTPESRQVRDAVLATVRTGAVAAIGVTLLAAAAVAIFGSGRKERRNNQ